MFFTSLLICLFLFILYRYWLGRNSDYWRKRNVTYVEKTNPFGIVWEMLFENASVVHKRIYDKHKNEPVVGIFFGSKPALLLRDPENVQAVFSSDFQSFYKRGVPVNKKELLVDHVLFIDEYKRWKLLRQKISPVFTSAKLKNMFYIIERCARDFTLFIDNNKDLLNDSLNLVSTYTAASIGASIFGIDSKVGNTMQSPFIKMARESVSPTFKRTIILLIKDANEFIKDNFSPKGFGEYEDFFIGIFKKVLKSRKEEGVKRHDFIDVCLDIQKNGTMKDTSLDYELEPTDEILAAQAFFFFLAGVETSAVTIHFTLLELANNPDILARLHKEIDDVFEECNEKVTYDDIDKLRYLEMVVNESMRKFPTIGVVQRVCTSDTILPSGNIPVKEGTDVFVPIYALHRDEKYYPDPEKFDPERFSADNIGNIVKYAYLPFGEGNRHCLGMRFARLQVLTGLAWLLRRYTLTPQNSLPEKFDKNFFSLRASKATFDLVPRAK